MHSIECVRVLNNKYASHMSHITFSDIGEAIAAARTLSKLYPHDVRKDVSL